MKCSWDIKTVKELIDEKMLEKPLDGNHGNSHPKSSDYKDKGIPFIMANDLENGTINYNNCYFIDKETASGLRKGFAKTGDVLITHKATIGRTAIVDNTYSEIVLTPQVTYYRIIKGINNRYLKFYFDSFEFQNLFKNWAGGGSTRLYLGITQQQNLPILLPPIKIQDQIAKILSSIDDKIELNNKINDNLEKQAQAIYSDMFANNDKNNILSDIANITMGQSPAGSSYNETGDGTVFYQGRAEFNSRFPKRRLFTTEPKRMAEENDILMSVRAPVGDINIAYERCCIGRGLSAIHSKTGHSSFLLYTMLSSKKELDVYNGEGTVFGSINREALNNLPIFLPNADLIQKFEDIVSAMDNIIRVNSDESERLTQFRDTLLPKLMSGEIDVSKVQV